MRHDDPRRSVLIAMLASGERPGVIAEHFNVSGEAVRTWRADAGVRAEVGRMRDEAFAEAREKLRALASAVPDALAEALQAARDRGSKDPGEIVKVCEAIADRVGMVKTSRVEQKIEAPAVNVDEIRALLRRRADEIARAQGGQG